MYKCSALRVMSLINSLCLVVWLDRPALLIFVEATGTRPVTAASFSLPSPSPIHGYHCSWVPAACCCCPDCCLPAWCFAAITARSCSPGFGARFAACCLGPLSSSPPAQRRSLVAGLAARSAAWSRLLPARRLPARRLPSGACSPLPPGAACLPPAPACCSGASPAMWSPCWPPCRCSRRLSLTSGGRRVP